MASSSDSFYSAHSETSNTGVIPPAEDTVVSDAQPASSAASPSHASSALPPSPHSLSRAQPGSDAAQQSPWGPGTQSSRSPASPPLALPRRRNSKAANAPPASAPLSSSASASRSPTRWTAFFSSGGGGSGDLAGSPSKSRRAGKGGSAADVTQKSVGAGLEAVEEEDGDDWGADFDSDEDGVWDDGAASFDVRGSSAFASGHRPHSQAFAGSGRLSAFGPESAAGPKSLFSFASQAEGLRSSVPSKPSNLRHVLSSGDVSGALSSDASFRLRAPALHGNEDDAGDVATAVIGIYADPTGEKDDWADDFQLGPGRAGSSNRDDAQTLYEPQSAVMDLLRARYSSGRKDRSGGRSSFPAVGSAFQGLSSSKRRDRPTPRLVSPLPTSGGAFGDPSEGGGDGAPESREHSADVDGEGEDFASVSLTLPSEISMGLLQREPVAGQRPESTSGPLLKRAPEKIRTAPDSSVSASKGEIAEVQASCRRFLDLCTRHLIAIETHLEGLREDRQSILALERAAESVYSFTSDQDVAKLTNTVSSVNLGTSSGHLAAHRVGYPSASDVEGSGASEGETQNLAVALGAAAKDVLLWKLEYARLTQDTLGTVGPLVGMARLERERGVVKDAFTLLEEARSVISSLGAPDGASESTRNIDTLQIEVQYETALTHLRAGDFDDAAKMFATSSDMGTALACCEDMSGEGCSSEQRGLWWALESKYMLAESLYDQKNFAEAVKHYVEYAMQAIARMIGLIAPSRPDQATVGSSLMRYCLFAPRRLALSIWSASLCLAEIGVVEVAANVGSMAMRAATALGVEDVRVATVEFCGRVKDTLREMKRRQIDAGESSAQPSAEHGVEGVGGVDGGDTWDSVGGPASLLRDLDAELAVDETVGMEEDWDSQIAREMNITIQRCCEATGPGTAVFSDGMPANSSAGAAVNVGGVDGPGAKNARASLLESHTSEGGVGMNSDRSDANERNDSGVTSEQKSQFLNPLPPGRSGDNTASNVLTESELRQYLNTLNSYVASMSSHQRMYPKPTQPFTSSARGPREHESFLREFVRRRASSETYSLRAGRYRFSEWPGGPSSPNESRRDEDLPQRVENVSRLGKNRSESGVSAFSMSSTSSGNLDIFDTVRECRARLRGVERGSSAAAIIHHESVWSVLRSRGVMVSKREQVRALVVSAFSHVSSLPPVSGGAMRGVGPSTIEIESLSDRMETVASLLELLKLAREILDPSGSDALWFADALSALVKVAATLTPAAKAAVELFRAETRAHCGVVAVTPPEILRRCLVGEAPSMEDSDGPDPLQSPSEDAELSSSSVFGTGSPAGKGKVPKRTSPVRSRKAQSKSPSRGKPPKPPPRESDKRVDDQGENKSSLDDRIAADLRVSVVDILHGLYWRTKAGIDESDPRPDAMECLVHADVSACLYLVGASVSPVTGVSLDVAKDESALSVDRVPIGLVDDTRRVSRSDLVRDLESLWQKLPRSSGEVRARVCFALSHHAQVGLREPAYAERLMFDALLGLDALAASDSDSPNRRPMLCVSAHTSPLAVVSSPLCGALLYEYGSIALRRSKYRYGIAALEAAVDGRKVRDPTSAASLASAREVAVIARSNYDWRRALSWLYDLRNSVQPTRGRRNDFVHLCLVLHEICIDAGCFDAAVIPLRAYSALLYEERLRALLERYRKRLDKRARSRRRYDAATSVLPSLRGRSSSASVSGVRTSPLRHFFDRSHSRSRSTRASAPDLYLQRGEDAKSRFGMRPRASSAVVSTRASRPAWRWSSVVAKYMSLFSRRSSIRRTASTPAEMPSAGSQNSVPRRRGGPSDPGSEGAGHLRQNKEEETAILDVEGLQGAEESGRRQEVVDKAHSVGSTSLLTDGSDGHGTNFEYEREELFAIAEEQVTVADSSLFEVELLKAKLEYDRGHYRLADSMCKGLLDMVLPLRGSKYYVLEIMARIRLKRREITRCLELVELMEHEAEKPSVDSFVRDSSLAPKGNSKPSSGANSFGNVGGTAVKNGHGFDEAESPAFFPEVAFLRLSALFHGGRLNEALAFADDALALCPEAQLWHRAKLHYLRGKVLFAMCSDATAPFEGEEVANAASLPVESVEDSQIVELTLLAFETASSYFDAAGDEVGMVKSDLRWAQTAIDVLFRRVVVKADEGEISVRLDEACRLKERTIIFSDLQDVVHSTVSFLSTANLPLLTIDALAALAEVKCIEGESSSSWSFWVSEAWKLFSRLLADPEEYRVVLADVAPVSTLMRLKNICGRLVRLVLCSTHVADVESINRHLGMFEAYVTLQVDIDRRMNLASSVHGQDADLAPVEGEADISDQRKSETTNSSRQGTRHDVGAQDSSLGNGGETAKDREEQIRSPVPRRGHENSSEFAWAGGYQDGPRKENKDRPAGAFLHLLGDEGVALGRQGFTVFVNRPRQRVVKAVKQHGAVLVPRNPAQLTKRRDKETATSRAYQKDHDAEYIFPFNEKFGLGAMYILDSASFVEADNDVPASTSSGEADLFNMDALSGNQIAGEGMPGIPVGDPGEPVDAVAMGGERGRIGDELERQAGLESQRRAGTMGRGGSGARSQEGEPGAESDQGEASQDNALSALVSAIRGLEEGTVREYSCMGESSAERVWSHIHRVKAETRRYSRGEITLEELGNRNGSTIRSWLRCVPRSRREWSVPEALGKRLVYILYAHGVVGYYSVDRGSCVSRLEFGGKQAASKPTTASGATSQSGLVPLNVPSPASSGPISGTAGVGQRAQPVRPLNDAERKFLYGLVKDWRAKGTTWYKDRESEIVNGLATAVLRTPRVLLETRLSASRTKTQKNRPVVLIVDLTLQVFPWELFLDHIVIRSLSLLDSIRGLQDDAFKYHNQLALQEAMASPTVALSRRIVRFVNFSSPRREGGDLERSEEARRQQLAFQSLLRLNHLSPPRLIACLELGGFSDPTALNAVARPTGPLSTPLTETKKAVNVLGVRLEAPLGRRNYSLLDFVKVPGLGSASTADLKEAAMVPILDKKKLNELKNVGGSLPKEIGAYIAVFLFTYADLVDVTESVFGLLRTMPRGILIFAPATKMKVVVRHLEDEELDAELQQASGRRSGRIVPDVGASARVIVEYVSRFARSKLIPIVVFLGEGLVEVWPQKRVRTSTGIGTTQGPGGLLGGTIGDGVGGYSGGGLGGFGGAPSASMRRTAPSNGTAG